MKTIFSFIAVAACAFMVSCSGCNKTEQPVEAPVEVVEEVVATDSLSAATAMECACETCGCTPCQCAAASETVAQAE